MTGKWRNIPGFFLVAWLVILPSILWSLPADAQVVLRRGNQSEPDTLDPQKSSALWSNNIIGDLFLGLTTESADGRTVPGVAARWEVSDDALTYIFYLREDVLWSDGSPVTADDFVYAYRRLLNPETAAQYASVLYILVNGEAVGTGKADPETLGVRALDDHTLELKLVSPTPYLLQLLTHAATYPVPRQSIDKYGNEWTRPGNIVSNGPFILADWKPQSYVRLEKNPDFYDAENVRIDEVYFYPTEDSSSSFKKFRAGELDVDTQFPARQLDWIKQNMPDEVRIAPWLGTYFYAFNTRKYPFNDRRVRLALSMAIERELITEKLLNFGVVPAWNLVPPGIENYGTGAKSYFHNWPSDKRVAEGKRLMSEAGFGPDNPLEVTISYNTSQDHKKIALAIAHGWKRLGVVTRLLNVEAKVQYANMRVGDFEVGRAGWIADFNDPKNFLFLMDSATGAMNYSKYNNPAYDALLGKASMTLDLEKRAAILQEAEQVAMDDQPLIPIYFYVSRNMVKPYVRGWIDNITDRHRTRYLWIERDSDKSSSPRNSGGS